MSGKTFASLFSGIGGIDKPLIELGYTRVFSCDFDKYANQIYTDHFGSDNHYAGDIRDLEAKSIPDHDILCAGFPCPSFSNAGLREGFEDTRGTLFFEVARIAAAKKPKTVLLENVDGLLSAGIPLGTGIYRSSKGDGKGELTEDLQRIENSTERGWKEIKINVAGGYCLAKILESLEGLWYHLEWQVLNSFKHGVPQNRARIFIIGHLGTLPGSTVFPVGKNDVLSHKKKYQGTEKDQLMGLLKSIQKTPNRGNLDG